MQKVLCLLRQSDRENGTICEECGMYKLLHWPCISLGFSRYFICHLSLLISYDIKLMAFEKLPSLVEVAHFPDHGLEDFSPSE